MYSMTGMGALPPDVRAAAESALPSCYSKLFDDCIDDEDRDAPRCRKFEPVHAAYDIDFDETDALVEAMPFCEYDTSKLLIAGVVGGVVGLMLGAAIAA